MRTALLMTAYDRPDYLRQVLDSWVEVRGLRGWHVRFAVEPSPLSPEVLGLVHDFVDRAGLDGVEVVVNTERLGVAENPYRHLGELFGHGYEFVVRAEDDLVVADDILAWFAHVATAYAGQAEVATAHAFTDVTKPGDPAGHARTPEFCPWVWGTWRDRWDEVIGPTWDRDYSTWNESPGFESGWDWNLNTRVFPARGLVALAPLVSRVDNIGVVGAHGTAENLRRAPSFRRHHAAQRWVEVQAARRSG